MAGLGTATRHAVVPLYQTKISKQTEVSGCAVQALFKRHKERNNTEDHRRSGQPVKLTAAGDSFQ